jgi:hypothetical protein
MLIQKSLITTAARHTLDAGGQPSAVCSDAPLLQRLFALNRNCNTRAKLFIENIEFTRAGTCSIAQVLLSEGTLLPEEHPTLVAIQCSGRYLFLISAMRCLASRIRHFIKACSYVTFNSASTFFSTAIRHWPVS